MNLWSDFSDAAITSLLSRRTSLTAKAAGGSYSNAQLDDLRLMVLDIFKILFDETNLTADDMKFSMGLSVDGTPNSPEFRHEVLMAQDRDYRRAWSYDHVDGYVDYANENQWVMDSVVAGQTKYAYRENDPEIVDRSLLRNGLRAAREGEDAADLPPLRGSSAPKYSVPLPTFYTTGRESIYGGTLS